MTPTLLDSKAVAKVLGIDVATVHVYKSRGELPPPTATFGDSPVWDAQVIKEWKAKRRTRGRPRKTDTDQVKYVGRNKLGQARTGIPPTQDLETWVLGRWRAGWQSLIVRKAGIEVAGIGTVDGKRTWWAQAEGSDDKTPMERKVK